MSNKGVFISFEGGEGSGKTTQIKLLRDYLSARGFTVVMTREPGGCPVGNQVRRILLDPGNAGMNSRAELLLYAAARAQHVEDVIKPALEAGGIVLCDRFSDSTKAYQGARGIDFIEIERINSLATSGIKPDITILLDIPVEVGLERSLGRQLHLEGGMKEARFELEDADFHQKVRKIFLSMALLHPRFRVIEAARSIEEIADDVKKAVDEYLCVASEK